MWKKNIFRLFLWLVKNVLAGWGCTEGSSLYLHTFNIQHNIHNLSNEACM